MTLELYVYVQRAVCEIKILKLIRENDGFRGYNCFMKGFPNDFLGMRCEITIIGLIFHFIVVNIHTRRDK